MAAQAGEDWIAAALKPRSIAIIGASDNPEKIGGRPIKYMLRHQYRGVIYPINPGRREVQGIRAWPSLDALPSTPDLAVVCVPGLAALEAVAACARMGVKLCIVISSGFGETGPAGLATQQEMVSVAKDAGMRLVGPNSQGLASFDSNALATFATLLGEVPPRDGPVAIVSQSGAMSMVPYALLRNQGIGVRYSFATGNEADLTVSDFALAAARDPEVKLILLYLEDLLDPATLAQAAQCAMERGIPMLALKAGVSDRGKAAALTHTGAVATEDKVLDAWFRQNGILRVADMRSLVQGARLLLRAPRINGRRLVILSNSGAACVMGADAAERHGLEVPPFPPAVQAAIAGSLPSFASAQNPVDLTAALLTNNHLFGDVLPKLDASCCDALFISLPMSGLGYDARQFAQDSARFQEATGIPVVLACPLEQTRRIFDEAGLVAFEHDEDAMAALGQLARIRTLQHEAGRLWRGIARPHHPRKGPLPATRFLSEADSLELLESAGVPTAPWRLCKNEDDIRQAMRTLDLPVAVKACSAEIPHKSEYGLVRLGIGDIEEACAIGAEMRATTQTLGKSCEGIIVASMVRGRRELVIGARWDEKFGSVLLIGDGGKYIEAMPDAVTLVQPFDLAHTLDRLRELRIAPLYKETRGDPPLPVEALAKLAVQVGAWVQAQGGRVMSVDINPLMALAHGGLAAADALVEININADNVPAGET
ncbi:CoA-binding protein [Achromobacter aloeverae]|uniref:CoA-binding protein n=2 Tax=Achromobacter aloeverae TaxID=1750518 RepID=A0A4Q1HCU3_9BURK|nr:CoA-binding protein [Achromobacter aloeverae]